VTPLATWELVLAIALVVLARRLLRAVAVDAAVVVGRLVRRARVRPEVPTRRRPGAALHLVDGVSRGWVGAGSSPDESTWRAPREAAPAPSPRRAA
jgi:hypothetical protein